MARTFGLIAGLGRFPFEVARGARRRGDAVFAAAIRGLTEPALESEVDELRWFHLGELQAFIDAFRKAGIRDAVMAGKVPKTFLYEHAAELHLDALALELLAGLADRKDDSLLGAFAEAVERSGMQLHGQADLVPELVAEEGVLGERAPSAEELADVGFGWPIAKAIGGLDVGQTVVVKHGAVLAVEAIEGTDAAIRRGAELGGNGVVVIKVAKPAQDPRFDVPVIGTETVECLGGAGAALLAVEARHTVILERARTLERASELGIAIVGIGAGGPAAAGTAASGEGAA